MKQSVFLLLTLFIVSCTSTVEIEEASYKSKFVVDGWIESGGYANVQVTKSAPFLSDFDSASIRAVFVNYAKVTLTSSKGESEVLTLYKQNNLFPPFVYRSNNIKGEPGCRYDIKVEAMNNVLTSSTTIPDLPVFTGLKMDQKSDSSGILSIGMVAEGRKDDFLLFMMKSTLGGERNFHPAQITVAWVPETADTCYFDILRDHETNMYLLNPEKKFYGNWPVLQFSLKDTVSVKVGRIDREAYEVLFSIYSDMAMRKNPFSLNTTGVRTNIKGGIGRWTGISYPEIFVYKGKK